MSPRLSTREISDRLSDDIQAVTYNLLREPNRALSTRSELRFGKKGSLSVVIRGPKRGKWFDHEAGAGGDAYGLVQRQIGRSGAREWALRWFGIEDVTRREKRPAARAVEHARPDATSGRKGSPLVGEEPEPLPPCCPSG